MGCNWLFLECLKNCYFGGFFEESEGWYSGQPRCGVILTCLESLNVVDFASLKRDATEDLRSLRVASPTESC